ncbi:MAG: hypothetical protein P4L62_00635 [Candidatus Pacebacteria bacterium]|nr:hypothetical protein [Candidatus Paceibacterota bacterium]
MSVSTKKSIRDKFAVIMLGAFLATGLGFVLAHPASADSGDGRYVNIGSNTYDVMHDGQGPNIRVSGMTYYLDAPSNDSQVLVAGKWYDVQGHEYSHHHHHHHDD